MTRIARWSVAWLCAGMAVAGLAGMPHAARAAPPGAVVCFSPALPPGPAGGSGGAPTASLAPTTGALGPSVRIALLAPQPATGALVVPVIAPLPSVPGVSLLHLEVLAPPAPSLRRDVSLETAQVLTSMLAAAGSRGAPARFVASCF